MRRVLTVSTMVLLGLLLVASFSSSHAQTIKIGFNIELSGDIEMVGESSKSAAEILKESVNAGGGIKVGNKTYKLAFLYEDNMSTVTPKRPAALTLIIEDKVLAIIGPNASKLAIPAAELSNALKTPMISPWSTNPKTTEGRPYVFRASFLDPFQGKVAARFVAEELGAKKAAVLYDNTNDYSNDPATYFKTAFENINGPGSVVAFESFKTGDRDFSAQITRIVNSGADVLFTPQYYNEVPLIVKQAQKLGWKKPIMGSDSWGSAQLMFLCGDSCKGYFFTTHFVAAGAKGAAKKFVDQYYAKYGYNPDEVAALTWDSIRLLLQAIQNTGGLSGDLEQDRNAVKDQLAKIREFEGITGQMAFLSVHGDPAKCAAIVKIDPNGEFELYKRACP
ncbi:MAG: ABC transporter substrate-binding protein [Desulfobacteraceae bacterium]|nr:ABC transporter substrate-binding protein [Desulfobacteraceae bacterium]